MRANATVGLSHSESCHLYGAEALHNDEPVGRDRFLYRLLRITIDVQIDNIARTNDIVARRRNIHCRFKSQLLIVEEIVAENLLFRPLLIFRFLLQIFPDHMLVVDIERVGHKLVDGVLDAHAFLCLFLPQQLFPVGLDRLHLAQFLVLHLPCGDVVAPLQVAVVPAQAAGGLVLTLHGSQPAVVLQPFHLSLNAPYLVGCHTFLHQFHGNLLLCRSGLLLLGDKCNYLLVGHFRLSKRACQAY